MIDAVYQMIQSYEPNGIQEIQDKQVMLEYISMFDNILTRDNNFAHITASPWIVNHDYTKVLMVYHNIYRSWSWCGGHADGELDLLQVALREAKEESGIQHISPYTTKILALDILPVPPHIKRGKFVSSHVHLNVTYLCVANEGDALHHKEDENSAVKWIDINELNNHVSEEDMKVVYEKLNQKTKSITKKV